MIKNIFTDKSLFTEILLQTTIVYFI